MKHWQKLLLDPAAYTTLRTLHTPKTKKQLAEETGIQEQRMEKLLGELLEQGLIREEVENGKRTFHIDLDHSRVKQLRLEIEDHTTIEVENLVKSRNFHEARQEIHRKPLVDDLGKRKALAKIEALEKLEQLPVETAEVGNTGRWQSLKGFIPRF